ncbi:uracil-DNA glycosylase [Lacipirellula limnantheis]|uniref:Type-4 uracil-DNA glycosylase n=1 Tax=Lacipirellula limnantheis TaxID=2528024 RepID=A0A517TUD2_9BACT|nr:uracil-DNA glycosylase [Lacipirellula limnantheis]QDT71981.1 Uracil DNA glycosylase superfamily protein [Lacipirellula limnantheis]
MTHAPLPPADNDRVRHALRQTLESLAGAGVRQLPDGRRTLAKWRELAAENASAAAAREPAAAIGVTTALFTEELAEGKNETAGGAATTVVPSDAANDVSPAKTLRILAQEVAECTRCHELAATRTQTVFGVGDPQARLCFLGEAPGADEDKQGEPFVGRAGQLLNKILEACKLRREDVYILNVLKCRPPGNRNPLPEESLNCRRYLNRQLQLIQPEFICCLGSVAAQNLLETTETIGRLRGKVHQFRGVKVVCTYHPAYLLRNPSAKKQTWEDMKLLMRELGTPVD